MLELSGEAKPKVVLPSAIQSEPRGRHVPLESAPFAQLASQTVGERL